MSYIVPTGNITGSWSSNGSDQLAIVITCPSNEILDVEITVVMRSSVNPDFKKWVFKRLAGRAGGGMLIDSSTIEDVIRVIGTTTVWRDPYISINGNNIELRIRTATNIGDSGTWAVSTKLSQRTV